MEKKEEQPGALSFLPIALIGIAMILLFQLPGSGSKPATDQDFSDTPSPVSGKDFDFQRGGDERLTIDNENMVITLNAQGGRIEKIFLKKTEEVPLPDSVVAAAGPESAAQKALEVTRGHGMDFQFHTYYQLGDGSYQLTDPPLNHGAFRLEGPINGPDGLTEVRFRAPVQLKGANLEIIKVYRFRKGERFFRMISVIRNKDRRDFVWGGDLFYRPFGDMGPQPDPKDGTAAQTHGRFYYYNGSLTHRPNLAPSNDFLAGLGCGEKRADVPYSVHMDNLNMLSFMGTHSKYFLSYTKFLEQDNALSRPDGIALRNHIDPAGRQAMTAIFRDFRLAAEAGPFNLVSSGNLTGDRAAVKALQARNDALILDQQVFVGLRSDEAHSLKNAEAANREFGSNFPDKEARGVIYNQSFLALFSEVRDGIVWAMRFLYKYIGNYGWVIILIAVGFKLLTFPLNQMQAKSMKKMSLLKPEMERINEKYADNPQEKQKKIMELYKKHNVNPAKGCLPILIQIPIFIALYSAFSESIELWQSPFVFWMTDLSQPDTAYVLKDLFFWKDLNFHLNILPLFMVVSQLLQQRLTTVVTDPQQKIMMYMMPVIMIFFFWTMPSGVTLYWTVQNILAIGWQLISNRFSSDEAKV